MGLGGEEREGKTAAIDEVTSHPLMDAGYLLMKEIWRWIRAHWQWVTSTLLIGGFSLLFAYLQWRQNAIKQQVEFRKALNRGHDLLREAEKPWEKEEERDERKQKLAQADRAYEDAYDYARGKKQRALVCFYRAICAEQRGYLTEPSMGRENCFAKSKEIFTEGLRLSRMVMIEEALKQARDYAARCQESQQQDALCEEMAKLLYDLAEKWTKNRKRKAEIAFEFGRWRYELRDPHRAKESFQRCHALNACYDRILFWEAMADIDLGSDSSYQSAAAKLRQHLEQYPDDTEAQGWLEEVEKELMREKFPTEDVVA